jgi:hypothetical protein
MINGIKYRLIIKERTRELRSNNPKILAPLKEERKRTEKESIEVEKLIKIGIPLYPMTLMNPRDRFSTS